MLPNFGSPLFLYGPSGSGKTTIGKKLAAVLDWRFIDLDQEIENRVGRTIPEIFDSQGESIFRQYESIILSELINKEQSTIIALGGGTLLSSENRLRVEKTGKLLCLSAPVEILSERLLQDKTLRPLLIGGSAKTTDSLIDRLSTLVDTRHEHYSSFENQLNTAGLTVDEAVHLAQVRFGLFHVTGMGKGYYIHIQPESMDRVDSIFSSTGLQFPISIVMDSNVFGIYADRVIRSFISQGARISPVTIPAGEDQKNIHTIVKLWDAFLSNGIERTSTIIALGGGVVGDLTGFAAATYLRGVSWVNIPTTLLSMVDASLGGKTGIDLPQGKNLAGAFHAPRFVLSDPTVLSTLPQEEFVSGMAEVVKAGVISDPGLFALCADGMAPIKEKLVELIQRAVGVKVRILEIDPFEKGERAALNYGHTLGHAIEFTSGFKLRHGEAIAIGMVLEARLSEMLQLCHPGLSDRIAEVLSTIGLPTRLPTEYSFAEISQVMQKDKKRLKGEVRFALPVDIGEVRTNVNVEEKWIKQLF